ncbi:MAG: DNA polymerase IV [Sphaerochaetaceae bacterium]|jgi:DNA polymerase-4|nr:DNA polymerase IV [Sphaerochaetaceae bacterium]MDD4218564.1 DNA polymerase IV [Sphaerochaetaceae bacterium]MDY0371406.1 DNA polymerase IV [Sphaerochaetaceae bacterium]
METIWFHVDMDAFYAAIEQLDHPEYRGNPVIVGGLGNRGVVSACSYEARVFGVHSAMPIYKARQLCPQAHYVRPRMERYSQISRKVISILETFSPVVQQISIDEAFLDMSGTERLFGKPRQAAILLKTRVKNETGLVISVGIGASRFIAKMASGYDKPDGLCRVSPGNEIAFVDAVGLKKLWGIGESTLKALARHSITSVPHLRQHSLNHLQQLFGEATGLYLHQVSHGLDPGIHTGVTKSRSISTEMTFPVDVSKRTVLEQNLLGMSHEVMFRTIQEGVLASTVTVKIRFSDFSTISVQTTAEKPFFSAEQVFTLAKSLLASRWQEGQPVRLLGVALHSITAGTPFLQQELFENPYQRKRDLEKVVLNLRSKGRNVQKASLLTPQEEEKSP